MSNKLKTKLFRIHPLNNAKINPNLSKEDNFINNNAANSKKYQFEESQTSKSGD
jgi:hypothetical protein